MIGHITNKSVIIPIKSVRKYGCVVILPSEKWEKMKKENLKFERRVKRILDSEIMKTAKIISK